MQIKELFNYPVAGMQGEQVDALQFTPEAITGNRSFVVVDTAQVRKWVQNPSSGEPLRMTQSAHPELALLRAETKSGYLVLKYKGETFSTPLKLGTTTSERPHLISPDQGIVKMGEDVLKRFAFPIKVSRSSKSVRWAVDCGDAIAAWLSPKIRKTESVRLFQAVDSSYSQKQHFTWYTDLHLITQASLAALNTHLTTSVDQTPFRPNIVIDGEEAFAELLWSQIVIGEMLYTVKPCERCGYVAVNQKTGQSDRSEVLIEIVKNHEQNFGVYLSTAQSSQIAVGDEITVVQSN